MGKFLVVQFQTLKIEFIFSKIDMNNLIADIYYNIEIAPSFDGKSPDREKWEGILRRLEELQLY